MMMITQGRADDNNGNSVNETPYELLERQRAVLACFMLSSKYVSIKLDWGPVPGPQHY